MPNFTPIGATIKMGAKCGTEEWTEVRGKFHPHRCKDKDGFEIWHEGVDRNPCKISPLSVQRQRWGRQNWKSLPTGGAQGDLRRGGRHCFSVQYVIFCSNFCHSSIRRVSMWLMSRMPQSYLRQLLQCTIVDRRKGNKYAACRLLLLTSSGNATLRGSLLIRVIGMAGSLQHNVF